MHGFSVHRMITFAATMEELYKFTLLLRVDNAILTVEKASVQDVTIQRVEYEYHNWADTLECEGIDPVFIEPLRTGIWTSGLTSLPTVERNRYLINLAPDTGPVS